jgi:hypothetical protein
MEHIHVDAGQTFTVIGPAKLTMVSDTAPVVAVAPTPTISALTPATAVAADPTDITMVIDGTDFNEFSVITFNGIDEPTTLISPTQVSTGVKPSLFVMPADCPVTVRNGSLVSNELIFSFTATAGTASAHNKRPARKS